MRAFLPALVFALVFAGACRAPEGPAVAPTAVPAAAPSEAPTAQPTPTSAVQAADAATVRGNPSSAWISCDPGIAGVGICVSPDPQHLPVRVCEEGAGVCHERVPTQTILLAHGPLDVVRDAYRTLLDNYVDPLSPHTVLQAALDAAAQELRAGGLVAPVVQVPPSSGNVEADWAAFARGYEVLENAAAGARVDRQQVAHAAIRGLAASVNDGHTLFLSPSEYGDHLAWQRGDLNYAGIGVRLAGSPPTVFEVFLGSPSERAGLRYGDQIIGTEGRSTASRRLEETIATLRGPVGTSVRVRVRHASGAVEEVTLLRDTINVEFVESRVLRGAQFPVGYVRVRGFPESSVVSEVERAIGNFRAQGVGGLVLDLRGNTGGRMDVGTRALGLFVPNASAFVEVTRLGRSSISTPGGEASAGGIPLAVLVDEATSSMGEIFAAAVQEHDAGSVVGMTTAGNVAAGQVFPLSDGSALQVTVHRIESAAGRRLNGVGVRPDLVVSRTAADVLNGRDPQLEAALTYLAANVKQAVGG